MTKHTETPWVADGRLICRTDNHMNEIADICGFDDAHPDRMVEKNIDEDEANAAFIVRACNAHDELVAALEALESAHLFFKFSGIGDAESEAIDLAVAALAKAKGEA